MVMYQQFLRKELQGCDNHANGMLKNWGDVPVTLGTATVRFCQFIHSKLYAPAGCFSFSQLYPKAGLAHKGFLFQLTWMLYLFTVEATCRSNRYPLFRSKANNALQLWQFISKLRHSLMPRSMNRWASVLNQLPHISAASLSYNSIRHSGCLPLLFPPISRLIIPSTSSSRRWSSPETVKTALFSWPSSNSSITSPYPSRSFSWQLCSTISSSPRCYPQRPLRSHGRTTIIYQYNEGRWFGSLTNLVSVR